MSGHEPDVDPAAHSFPSPDVPGLEPPSAGMAPDLPSGQPLQEEAPGLSDRLKHIVIGRPRDLQDKSLFSHVTLVAFFAWVGLGADGLSSSCYGPSEAFSHLGEHAYLAVFLAAAIIATVFVIATCYSHIIEEFPSGGGGYLVASKLLGPRVGVISGCALLVDYVLTITVSIAAAGDAIFGLVGPAWAHWRLPVEYSAIGLLIVLNLRGVKESVKVLMPVFLIFVATHVALVVGSVALHLGQAGEKAGQIVGQVHQALITPEIGFMGIVALLLRAYSLGAGTYTGLEAVSNSMPVMREPRVATAKRTMRYMAFSLAFTAGGLLVAYLLLGVEHPADEIPTMNQLLTDKVLAKIGLAEHWSGTTFLWTTLLSEGFLLFVAAQAGFIDGPRILANMAQDSWMPRWFANLSDRLATHNGIMLMGLSALAALAITGGETRVLVVMYSINVFVTFSLSMIGMTRHWWSLRGRHPLWRRRLALFVFGGVLCVAILVVTLIEKSIENPWRTLGVVGVTGLCVAASFFINHYYRRVGQKLKQLDQTLGAFDPGAAANVAAPDANEPTAVVLVGGFSGIGIHTMLAAIRFVPHHFKSFVFLSVGVVDSGNFKGAGAVDDLRQYTEESLKKYVAFAQGLGMPATYAMSVGTDAVDELDCLCRQTVQTFPHAMVFAGQLVFQKDTWLHRLLHNQTAYSLQRRLQWSGIPMVILPTRVR